MERVLRFREASEAVEGIGWRYLLGALCTEVPVGTMLQGSEAAAAAIAACGPDADRHLRVDVREHRVALALQSLDLAAASDLDVTLARRITETLGVLGLTTLPEPPDSHSVQTLELAIDAMDIAAIRPFWKAVFGYMDEPGRDGPTDALVDPEFRGPAIWFQQMDVPRPQRNRIHFDLCVPHDEADARMAAAFAAGGRLVYTEEAPAFWVLADAEGNEICITTWQGRQTDE
jgi:4a-hydroxytetrahydrobiopterin dehydratase